MWHQIRRIHNLGKLIQKSVQAAKAKCSTAVEGNEKWAIRPAALTIITTG
jgi:hypothetical protein